MGANVVVPATNDIRLGAHETLLLTEAARLIRRSDTPAVVDFSLERFAKRLEADGSECLSVSDDAEKRNFAIRLVDAAAGKSSGILGFYYSALRGALESSQHPGKGKRTIGDNRIDIEKVVNPSARNEVINYEQVECFIEKLQTETASWIKRNYKGLVFSGPDVFLDPSVLSQRSISRFLRGTYLRLMRKVVNDVNRMSRDTVRGVVDFLKDGETLVVLSAFGCLDDRYLDTFVELQRMMWLVHGVDCINNSLLHIHEKLFGGDHEKTAIAVMGHEVSSLELMRWILGHRLAGFNVMRMHGNLIVQQIGCAVENLLRAVTIRKIGMVRQIIEYLQDEVSFPEDDPVAEHARLTQLKRCIQAARGLPRAGHSSEPPLFLKGFEDRVSDELRKLERLLLKRGGGALPPSRPPPVRQGTSTRGVVGAADSGTASVAPLSRGPTGSMASMLPSVGAVAQQGAFTTFRMMRCA